jgi:Holliday junction resolvasome RuvABC DNA-binding subunit
MNREFPLYPTLPEAGKKEAQKLISEFKVKLIKLTEEIIRDFYCDVVTYIESNSWSNFRRELLEGLMNYDNRKIQGKYNFKEIRHQIYKEYWDELIKDLNKDLLEKVEELEKENKYLLDAHFPRHF